MLDKSSPNCVIEKDFALHEMCVVHGVCVVIGCLVSVMNENGRRSTEPKRCLT